VSARTRRNVVLAPGPGPGEGLPTQRLAVIGARIVVVATIVIGQLWALDVALNAYYRDEMDVVWWLLGFQVMSFVLTAVVWLASPRDR
jgi:hypothetical protein